MLGASRGEGGILGEGVRQALLRDPTYVPALSAARGRWSRRLPARMRRDPRSLEDPAAEVAELLDRGGRAGGHIVLTGGSTPKRAYELAAARDADWSGATVWFSDERCVPPDDETPNFADGRRRRCCRALDARRPRVMRMEGELGAEAAAGAYEALLREQLGADPRLDLAAARPRARTRTPRRCSRASRRSRSTRRLVVGVPMAGMEPQVPRITLTLPALNARPRGRLPDHRRRQGRRGGARVRRPAGPDAPGRAACARARRAARLARRGRGGEA